MSNHTRSLKYRSIRKEIMPWLWRMGVTKDNHTTVYWIRGLGYFVAPKGISISSTRGHTQIFTRSNGVGRSARTLHQDDNEYNIRKIREACEYVGRNGELYSHSVQYNWLTNKPYVVRIPGRGVEVRVHVTSGIVDKYPCQWGVNDGIHKNRWLPVGTRQFKQTYLEFMELKKEMVQLFKDRYKITVDDVMVFHDTCPELLSTEA